jgi:hypothetical protein
VAFVTPVSGFSHLYLTAYPEAPLALTDLLRIITSYIHKGFGENVCNTYAFATTIFTQC